VPMASKMGDLSPDSQGESSPARRAISGGSLPLMADTRLQEAIRSFLERTGWSERALSTRARLNEKAVSQILTGKSQNPRIDTVESLAIVMGVAVDDLIERGGQNAAASAPEPSALPRLPTRMEAPKDVPVLGTAMGANGDGAFLLNQTAGVVDRAPRYPGLKDNRRAFAIYVEGDSMWPRFDPGDLIYVDPNRPVRIGDDVVIVVANRDAGQPPQAYLKHLVRRSPSKVTARQFNPDKTVEFEGDLVREIYRVLRPREWMLSG